MARKLNKIIVVDVECTCWEHTPREEQNEIIEVGYAELDLPSLEITKVDSLLVLPTTSTISEFCTKLTGWLPEHIAREGLPFATVCETLRQQNARHYTFASWGDYDRNQFERQCSREGVVYPWGSTHLNIKNLFAIKHGLTKEVGMTQALELAGLPLVGLHHRGVDDAVNIATLLRGLLLA